jgi:hypothetical protein
MLYTRTKIFSVYKHRKRNRRMSQRTPERHQAPPNSKGEARCRGIELL